MISLLRAQAPSPDFSANAVSGCAPLGVSFKDLSTGNPIAWAWDFGNGLISSLQDPSTTYNTPGTYTVTLIVRNSSGANSIRKTNYITVYPSPSVGFTSNLTLACIPANIQFTDHSTPGQGAITQWDWSFGDGSSSTSENPAHMYTATGYYNVGLKVTNSGGCSVSGSINRYIRVVSGVQTNFTWNQATPTCTPPFVLNFINQTAGPGNLSYTWNLGNGASSSLANPSATYPSNTGYTVSLTAESNLGCSQTIQQVISFSGTNAVITSPDSACLNTPVSFTNGSAPAPATFTWAFSDGTTSTDPNPSKTYNTTGIYTVKLVNTYTTCADSTIKTVTVVNNPVAGFTASGPTASCQPPLTVSFQDQTTPGAKAWLWNFGDGSTSTAQNPTHTYTTIGNFNVTLTATSSVGCTDTVTLPAFVTVMPPTVGLANPGGVTGCISTATFDTRILPVAAITAVDGVRSYAWTAPGSNEGSSSAANPVFTYPGPGVYSLSLTITTNGGCTASNTFPNVVHIGTPTTPIDFTITPASPICGSSLVRFQTTSTPANGWSWNFGDGAVDTASATVFHSYSSLGVSPPFTVTLLINNQGCLTSAAKTIQVSPPVPNFGWTVNCAPPISNTLSVTMIDSSLNGAVTPTAYTWDFGDGSVVPPVTAPPYLPPTHVYAAHGSYTITLSVSNALCSNIPISKTINLGEVIPSFTAPATACKYAPFTVKSTSVDPLSMITLYQWQFGPGGFYDEGPTANSSLNVNGTAFLNLRVTDINGCIYNAPTQFIQITGPIVALIAPTGGCKNSPIPFTDHSTAYAGPPSANPITAWSWNFGDGSPNGAAQDPTHSYTDTGSYNINLKVTDNIGCYDTTAVPAAIQITAPQASFSVGRDTVYCPNIPLPFKDSSQGYGLTYNWNFGDGGTVPESTAPSPSWTFPNNGRYYTVSLAVTDQAGCTSTMVRNNYIHIQSPIPAFTMQDTTSICTPLETIFTPQAQYYDSLYWDFGDGTSSTLPSTSHFYNTYDTFKVSLVLQGNGGCLDSVTQRVLVLNPYALTSFIGSPTRACDSVLTNFSILPPGYTVFSVSFGDGQTDASQRTALTHLYKNPSSYTPILTLVDSTGCIVNISNADGNVTVLGAVPFFSIDRHAFCDSATLNFTDFTITNDGILSETYTFGDGSPDGIQASTPFNTSHFYGQPGTFPVSLKVVTSSLCTETYTDTVKDHQTPHPVISYTPPLCLYNLIPLTGSLVTPEVSGDTVNWSWNFGDGRTSGLQDPTVTYTSPGPYNVTLHTFIDFGCNDSTAAQLVFNPVPTINGPSEITVPVGSPVTIPFVYSSDIVNYSWAPSTGLSCTDCSNPTATLVFSTQYIVTVTDSSNCTGKDTILIKTVCNDKNYFLPNTFSPNGDGVNDVFYPRGTSVDNIQSMRIFNRWGQLVFEKRNFPANSASEGWNGTFNGRPAPSDAYIYIVEVICDNGQVVALRGDITLIR